MTATSPFSRTTTGSTWMSTPTRPPHPRPATCTWSRLRTRPTTATTATRRPRSPTAVSVGTRPRSTGSATDDGSGTYDGLVTIVLVGNEQISLYWSDDVDEFSASAGQQASAAVLHSLQVNDGGEQLERLSRAHRLATPPLGCRGCGPWSTTSSASLPSAARRTRAGLPGRRRGDPGRGDRRLPQRLARLAGSRPRREAAAHPRTRVRRDGRLRVGADVRSWTPGQRVTVPFVCACGSCPPCREGNGQVCVDQTQPGFTHPGSFAEQVAVRHADVNLVALPGRRRRGHGGRLGLSLRDGLPGGHRSTVPSARATGWPCTAAVASGCRP